MLLRTLLFNDGQAAGSTRLSDLRRCRLGCIDFCSYGSCMLSVLMQCVLQVQLEKLTSSFQTMTEDLRQQLVATAFHSDDEISPLKDTTFARTEGFALPVRPLTMAASGEPDLASTLRLSAKPFTVCSGWKPHEVHLLLLQHASAQVGCRCADALVSSRRIASKLQPYDAPRKPSRHPWLPSQAACAVQRLWGACTSSSP